MKFVSFLQKGQAKFGISDDKNITDLTMEAKKMFGKTLITPQTGSAGKKVQRLYFEETCPKIC